MSENAVINAFISLSSNSSLFFTSFPIKMNEIEMIYIEQQFGC